MERGAQGRRARKEDGTALRDWGIPAGSGGKGKEEKARGSDAAAVPERMAAARGPQTHWRRGMWKWLEWRQK